MNFKNVIFKQHGQAMVEYAILLILMVTLIMGGLELSVTAYNSKKTGDAAEAGANAWAEAISEATSSNATALAREDSAETYRQNLNIDTEQTLADRNDDGSLVTAESCDVLPSNTCPPLATAASIRPMLNSTCASVNTFLNADINLPIDITACDSNKSGHTAGLLSIINDANINQGTSPNREFEPIYNSHPQQDFSEMCTSEDNDESIEKIITCRDLVDIYNTDSNSDEVQDTCNTPPAPCADGIDDLDPTFRRLLIQKSLINDATLETSNLPFKSGVFNRVSLGNHNNLAAFTRPSCSATVNGNINDYSDGLPNDGRIYLFNPLPIDISNCLGQDALRNNSSRASILVGGFRNNATPALNIEGLPALNQAVYSEYIKVCVVENAGQITIARNGSAVVGLDNCTGNGRAIWLKPPGKMCGAGTTPGTEFCPGIGNLNGATGFYFFGRTNDAVNNTLTDPQIIATFRPAFQIVCDAASLQNANTDAGGSCLANGTGSFALEVHTRYRSIFESFLTFGFNRLANANLAQYFYNPNGVGTSGAVVGAAGSELGPVESIANPIPSLKKIKDFRGCYRVDISPPDKIGEQVKTAVSSCN